MWICYTRTESLSVYYIFLGSSEDTVYTKEVRNAVGKKFPGIIKLNCHCFVLVRAIGRRGSGLGMCPGTSPLERLGSMESTGTASSSREPGVGAQRL